MAEVRFEDPIPVRKPRKPRATRTPIDQARSYRNTVEPKAELTKAQANAVFKILLATVNTGFVTGARLQNIELDPDDPLKPEEIALLSDALTEEAWRSNAAKRAIQRLYGVTTHGQLLLAVSMVAAPRLERRGIIPAGSTASLFQALAVSVATGGPSSGSGGNGFGEEHSSSNGFATTEDFLGRTEDEARSDRVSSGSNSEPSGDTQQREVEPNRTKTTTTVPDSGTS